jgi:hypothetical protein
MGDDDARSAVYAATATGGDEEPTMRDLLAIRNRLMAAMGFVAAHAGAGCASPSVPPTPAADSTPGGNLDTAPDEAFAKTGVADGTPADLVDAPLATQDLLFDPRSKPEVIDAALDMQDLVIDPGSNPEVINVQADVDADAAADVPMPPDANVNCGGAPIEQFCLSAQGAKYAAEWAHCKSTKCPGDDGPDAGGDAEVCQPKPYAGPLPPQGCPWPGAEVCQKVSSGWVVGDTCCYLRCNDCVCGRPFVVDGITRTAETVPASPWSARDVDAATVPTAADRALAAAWRAVALDEHASVASFHQFGLELLAVGAPPDLVRDAALAAADEVEHARACLAIATRLDGSDAGPGKLDCGGVRIRGDLVQLAVATVREGCIGETLSAALARHAAADATEARLAQTLAAMADDELRHAELAWRFVNWALAQGGESVADAVAAAFADAVAAGPAVDSRRALLVGIATDVLRRSGRLPADDYERAALSTLSEVVVPCALRLLGHRAEAGFVQSTWIPAAA